MWKSLIILLLFLEANASSPIDNVATFRMQYLKEVLDPQESLMALEERNKPTSSKKKWSFQSVWFIPYKELNHRQKEISDQWMSLMEEERLSDVVHLINKHPFSLKWKNKSGIDPLKFSVRLFLEKKPTSTAKAMISYLAGKSTKKSRENAFFAATISKDVELIPLVIHNAFNPALYEKKETSSFYSLRLKQNSLLRRQNILDLEEMLLELKAGVLLEKRRSDLATKLLREQKKDAQAVLTAYGLIDTLWLPYQPSIIPTGVFVGGKIPNDDPHLKEKVLVDWETILALREKIVKAKKTYLKKETGKRV